MFRAPGYLKLQTSIYTSGESLLMIHFYRYLGCKRKSFNIYCKQECKMCRSVFPLVPFFFLLSRDVLPNVSISFMHQSVKNEREIVANCECPVAQSLACCTDTL